MNPYFFSDPATPLFVLYHPPESIDYNEKAVLICPPVGQEYIRTHRALHKLAESLSQESCHVFRFDYYGMGDSAGEYFDADIETWLGNIREAADELRENSGLNNIVVVGMRMGATLAAVANIESSLSVFVDPVVSGKEYLRGDVGYAAASPVKWSMIL